MFLHSNIFKLVCPLKRCLDYIRCQQYLNKSWMYVLGWTSPHQFIRNCLETVKNNRSASHNLNNKNITFPASIKSIQSCHVTVSPVFFDQIFMNLCLCTWRWRWGYITIKLFSLVTVVFNKYECLVVNLDLLSTTEMGYLRGLSLVFWMPPKDFSNVLCTVNFQRCPCVSLTCRKYPPLYAHNARMLEKDQIGLEIKYYQN